MKHYKFDEKNWENIPEELANLKRWILWKYARKKYPDGITRLTKIPMSGISHSFFRRKEFQCLPLKEIRKIYKSYCSEENWSGIGFSSHGTENILVLDFDNCIENSVIKSNVLYNLIYKLNSYTEISPSGNGIRIFLKYNTADRINYSFQLISNRGVDLCNDFCSKGVELWNKNKFATVTGNLFDKNLNKINTNINEIEELITKSKKIFEDYLKMKESLNLPKIERKEFKKIEDCATFSDEENFWDTEEEQYLIYNNDDEYEDPFHYINPESLKDGSYQDDTPLV